MGMFMWIEESLEFGCQKLQDVDDEAEARRRGFPKGSSFKLLQRDVVLVPETQS